MNGQNTGREWVKDSPYVIEKRREELRKSINRHKVDIDRSVFSKSKKEKDILKKEKLKFKNK